jgi:hypothetical protein
MEQDLEGSDSSGFEIIDTPEDSTEVETALLSGSRLSDRLRKLSVSTPEDGHPPWQGHRDRLIGLVDMGR